MKFRYFIRGLGIGIVFASIIFLTAYQGNGSKELTDAEIIERAKDLGMVEKENHLKNLLSSEDDVSENVSVSEETQKSGENSSTGDATKQDTGENTTKQDAENGTGEKKTEANKDTEQNTTKSDTAKQDAEKEKDSVTITIERGASSYPICEKLQELGMIEDAAEFDTYLVEKGYASRIRVGTHTLKKGMSFHDIAEAISDPL